MITPTDIESPAPCAPWSGPAPVCTSRNRAYDHAYAVCRSGQTLAYAGRAVVGRVAVMAQDCAYDGPGQHAMTACSAPMMDCYFASGGQILADSADPTDERMAANPINYRDPTGLKRLPEKDLSPYALQYIKTIENGIRSGRIDNLDLEIEKLMQQGATYDQADTIVQIAAERAGLTIDNSVQPECPDKKSDLLTDFLKFAYSVVPFQAIYGYGGVGLRTPGDSKLGAGGEVGIGVYLGTDGTASAGPEGAIYGGVGPASGGGAGWSDGGGPVGSYSIGIVSLDWVYDKTGDQTYIGISVGEGLQVGIGIVLGGRWPVAGQKSGE